MAIIDNQENKKQAPQAQAPQQQQPEVKEANTNQPDIGEVKSYFSGASKFMFSDQGTVFGMNLDVINDGLMKLEKTIDEVVSTRISNAKIEIGAIPLDHHNHRLLPLDVMLIVARRRDINAMAVYAVAIANSDDVLTTIQTDEINGRRFNVDMFPSQIFNEKEIKALFVEKAKEKYENEDVIYAGGSILYADQTDFTDQDVVLKILLNAVAADITASFAQESRAIGRVVDLNIGQHDKEEELVCERKIMNGTVLDEYSRPVRADFMFTINSNNLSTAPNGKFNTQVASKEVTSITGFIDVLMVSPQNAANGSPWSSTTSPWDRIQYQDQQGKPSKQMYATNIVFTSLNPTRYQSIGNMVWSLACGVAASWDKYWWVCEGLNPSNQPPQTNIHSVAGLGYEISAALRLQEFAALPVDSPEFNAQQWNDYIQEYFTPRFSFSLEVAEASAGQWKYEPFLRAAYEKEEDVLKVGSANHILLAHTDRLCDGKFLEIYRRMGGSGRVCRTLDRRVTLMGQYHNSVTNTTRSIQDFDRRFLLNLVNGRPEQMELVRDWTMAQVEENLKPEQRIGIQQEIVRQVAAHAKINGYGLRVDFEDIYIHALYEAIAAAGMVLVNRNITQPTGQFYYANYINNSMLDNLGRSIMTQGTQRQSNFSGFFGFGGQGSGRY